MEALIVRQLVFTNLYDAMKKDGGEYVYRIVVPGVDNLAITIKDAQLDVMLNFDLSAPSIRIVDDFSRKIVERQHNLFPEIIGRTNISPMLVRKAVRFARTKERFEGLFSIFLSLIERNLTTVNKIYEQ